MLPGSKYEYLSSDSVCLDESFGDSYDERLYAPDILNFLNISGLAKHKLVLKVGVPIMLLRNINHKDGLCNGTRLQITSLGERVIKAQIISGANISDMVFIPRIALTPIDKTIPFKFRRRQYPVSVCLQ